jgi:cytochrome c oxidase subunit 1
VTVTETRPGEAGTVDAPAPASASAGEPGLQEAAPMAVGTADHKQLGLVLLVAATTFLVLGVVIGELLQAQLAAPGTNVVGDRYGELFSLHATATAVLFLGPFWLGLGTYLLPLQIGSSRLALPRLHAFATWLYVVGGLVFLASYVAGIPTRGGITLSQPLAAVKGLDRADVAATSLWVGGLFLVGLASVLASGDLIVTMLKLRVQGMTLARVPMFSWATFATSAVVVLATPVFLGGLTLLYLDQRYGGSFFSSSDRAGAVVWQHSLWLFGRPEAFILLLPGLGAAGDIVSTHFRRPLIDPTAARTALVAFAALSFTVWATGPSRAGAAVVLPTSTWLPALVAAPVAASVLIWLATARGAPPRFHISLAYVAGGVLLLALGAGAAIIAPAARVRAGTAWTTGHLHVVLFGAPTLLAFGAVHHWAPKLFGRRLSSALGALQLLLVLGGFAMMGVAHYILGYRHMPWHVDTYARHSLRGLHGLAAAGGGLVFLGVLVFVAAVLTASLRRSDSPGDPYGGMTLEWATASPPPRANFETLPEVRSATPLADLRRAQDPGATGGAAPGAAPPGGSA